MPRFIPSVRGQQVFLFSPARPPGIRRDQQLRVQTQVFIDFQPGAQLLNARDQVIFIAEVEPGAVDDGGVDFDADVLFADKRDDALAVADGVLDELVAELAFGAGLGQDDGDRPGAQDAIFELRRLRGQLVEVAVVEPAVDAAGAQFGRPTAARKRCPRGDRRRRCRERDLLAQPCPAAAQSCASFYSDSR